MHDPNLLGKEGKSEMFLRERGRSIDCHPRLSHLSKSKSSQKIALGGYTLPLVVSTLTSSCGCGSIENKLMSESIRITERKRREKKRKGKNAIHQLVKKEGRGEA